VTVKAGEHVTSKILVAPGMQNFRVTGSFSTSGGSGNDIQAVLADEAEFGNWINGHKANVFYSTGQITNGKINVGPLDPGTYVLALSNEFSLLSDKNVSAEIEASWMARQ
jgi:hypothetical protein